MIGGDGMDDSAMRCGRGFPYIPADPIFGDRRRTTPQWHAHSIASPKEHKPLVFTVIAKPQPVV